jgi:hypothetical protein
MSFYEMKSSSGADFIDGVGVKEYKLLQKGKKRYDVSTSLRKKGRHHKDNNKQHSARSQRVDQNGEGLRLPLSSNQAR